MRTAPPATSTDLYQLTMAAGHWQAGRQARASYELFTRRLPKDRAYLLAGGLEGVIEYLTSFHFTEAEIAYLRDVPSFSAVPKNFFDDLARLRFTGDVWALPEGTPVFPDEPFLSISAPLIEAQLVETALLAIVNYPTSVATKASRIVEAAEGRSIVEFGARRAHGTEAALIAARAAYIGGCVGTSNVEAGMRFGIPVFGTVAHAWIMAFDDEIEAFRVYQRTFPDNAILLIDTYDTLRAARRITEAFAPGEIAGVRLDSGDLGELARGVRGILDDAGFQSTKILASGDLNEWSIAELLASGAPIDSFGVGTDLTTVRDAPALGVVYKLVELEENGAVDFKMKFSAGKSTWPGRKQIWRSFGEDGLAAGDVVTLKDEPPPSRAAVPLLEPVIRDGKRVGPPTSLVSLRERAHEAIRHLPATLKGRTAPAKPYPVEFSSQIRQIVSILRAELT